MARVQQFAGGRQQAYIPDLRAPQLRRSTTLSSQNTFDSRQLPLRNTHVNTGNAMRARDISYHRQGDEVVAYNSITMNEKLVHDKLCTSRVMYLERRCGVDSMDKHGNYRKAGWNNAKVLEADTSQLEAEEAILRLNGEQKDKESIRKRLKALPEDLQDEIKKLKVEMEANEVDHRYTVKLVQFQVLKRPYRPSLYQVEGQKKKKKTYLSPKSSKSDSKSETAMATLYFQRRPKPNQDVHALLQEQNDLISRGMLITDGGMSAGAHNPITRTGSPDSQDSSRRRAQLNRGNRSPPIIVQQDSRRSSRRDMSPQWGMPHSPAFSGSSRQSSPSRGEHEVFDDPMHPTQMGYQTASSSLDSDSHEYLKPRPRANTGERRGEDRRKSTGPVGQPARGRPGSRSPWVTQRQDSSSRSRSPSPRNFRGHDRSPSPRDVHGRRRSPSILRPIPIPIPTRGSGRPPEFGRQARSPMRQARSPARRTPSPIIRQVHSPVGRAFSPMIRQARSPPRHARSPVRQSRSPGRQEHSPIRRMPSRRRVVRGDGNILESPRPEDIRIEGGFSRRGGPPNQPMRRQSVPPRPMRGSDEPALRQGPLPPYNGPQGGGRDVSRERRSRPNFSNNDDRRGRPGFGSRPPITRNLDEEARFGNRQRGMSTDRDMRGRGPGPDMNAGGNRAANGGREMFDITQYMDNVREERERSKNNPFRPQSRPGPRGRSPTPARNGRDGR